MKVTSWLALTAAHAGGEVDSVNSLPEAVAGDRGVPFAPDTLQAATFQVTHHDSIARW